MTLLTSLVPRFNRSACELPAKSTETRSRPAYTIDGDEHGYGITVQLPGVARDGLEITAQEGELSVVGRRAWAAPASWTALYRETPRADFALTLTYGPDVDAEKIGAELKDGILRLSLPKAEAAKPRKITIS